jgi:hypothetical protein
MLFVIGAVGNKAAVGHYPGLLSEFNNQPWSSERSYGHRIPTLTSQIFYTNRAFQSSFGPGFSGI